MIDAHHVPPELQNLLMVVVGNKWPTGDEAALRAEAETWREVATALGSCAADLADVDRNVDAGLEGATRDAVDTFLHALVGAQATQGTQGTGASGAGPLLPDIVRCCDDAADALDGLANEIETLRIEILGSLAVLAVQLLVDATVLLFFGGAAAAAAEITLARVLCLAFLRRAATRALTRVAESVLAQVGFALLAQVIELGQHHRRSLDGGELATAAVNGAVAGTIGFGAGLLGGALGHGVGKAAADLAGLGTVGRSVVDLAWHSGVSSLTGMAEGAAQDATSGLSGDWVSGAANGAFNSFWGARHTAMNPRNLGSISPADHLEPALDDLLDDLFTPSRPPAGTPAATGDSPTGLSPTQTFDPAPSLPPDAPAQPTDTLPSDLTVNPWADTTPWPENAPVVLGASWTEANPWAQGSSWDGEEAAPGARKGSTSTTSTTSTGSDPTRAPARGTASEGTGSPWTDVNPWGRSPWEDDSPDQDAPGITPATSQPPWTDGPPVPVATSSSGTPVGGTGTAPGPVPDEANPWESTWDDPWASTGPGSAGT
ncbi:WXG100-like domain-containing protein [Actinacidiphila yeochonensis]|uniref:WXG100-like domain-containing protein n=1 Tax=Actinacidiphila yeochonensis TaxID=89050 RepID=UPI00056AD6DB|nr:hypothetical protein [Actinacidiphila yeochonensis]